MNDKLRSHVINRDPSDPINEVETKKLQDAIKLLSKVRPVQGSKPNPRNKTRFKNFLESLKGSGQNELIEAVKQGFQACFENELEYTGIGSYYYDSKAGKYYDKSTDMYVEDDVVQNLQNAQQRSNSVNNEVLKQAFKLGLIDGRDYQRNHSRVNWDEKMSHKMHINAKAKDISVVDLFEKAKEEYKNA